MRKRRGESVPPERERCCPVSSLCVCVSHILADKLVYLLLGSSFSPPMFVPSWASGWRVCMCSLWRVVPPLHLRRRRRAQIINVLFASKSGH